jgi:hypothetical protein
MRESNGLLKNGWILSRNWTVPAISCKTVWETRTASCLFAAVKVRVVCLDWGSAHHRS